MADIRTRGNRAILFGFFMRKRRNINFQEYLVEGRNHSYTLQAILAVVNQPRIRSIWVRLQSGCFHRWKVLSMPLLPPSTTSHCCWNSTPSWIWSIILSEKRKLQPHSLRVSGIGHQDVGSFDRKIWAQHPWKTGPGPPIEMVPAPLQFWAPVLIKFPFTR